MSRNGQGWWASRRQQGRALPRHHPQQGWALALAPAEQSLGSRGDEQAWPQDRGPDDWSVSSQPKSLLSSQAIIQPDREGQSHPHRADQQSPPASPPQHPVADLLWAAYKRILAPLLHHPALPFSGGGCRFQPTCSEYAALALATYGPLRGTALALRRLCRCHPFSRGGWDPVPAPQGTHLP